MLLVDGLRRQARVFQCSRSRRARGLSARVSCFSRAPMTASISPRRRSGCPLRSGRRYHEATVSGGTEVRHCVPGVEGFQDVAAQVDGCDVGVTLERRRARRPWDPRPARSNCTLSIKRSRVATPRPSFSRTAWAMPLASAPRPTFGISTLVRVHISFCSAARARVIDGRAARTAGVEGFESSPSSAGECRPGSPFASASSVTTASLASRLAGRLGGVDAWLASRARGPRSRRPYPYLLLRLSRSGDHAQLVGLLVPFFAYLHRGLHVLLPALLEESS